MKLECMTWPEVDAYLARSGGVILPTGSTEQHGPIGLIGTDAICAREIAWTAADRAKAIVAPELAYTPAPFNMGFAGTVSIPEDLFEALARAVLTALISHGFRSLYVLNGHGANLAPLHAATSNLPAEVRIRSWWDFAEVNALRTKYYGDWEGMHATPSEIAITQHSHAIVHQGAEAPPEKLTPAYVKAHAGDKHGPPDAHRARFPDGRVGSHSALARPEHGKALLDAAANAVAEDYRAFLAR